MKYLQLFEHHSVSYQSIGEMSFLHHSYGFDDEGDIHQYTEAHWESMTPTEAQQLVVLLRTKFNLPTLSYALEDVNFSATTTKPKAFYARVEGQVEVLINKLRDEWYYLRVQWEQQKPQFYECDQLSGLTDCLKALVIK